MRLSRTATGLVRYLGLQGRTIYLRGVFASTLRSLPSMSKDERITRLDIVISDLFSRLFTLSYSLDCRILPQTVDIVARLRPWIDKYRYWSDRQRHFLHSISTLLTGGILILLQVKRRQLGGVEIGIKGLGDKGKVLTSFGSILTPNLRESVHRERVNIRGISESPFPQKIPVSVGEVWQESGGYERA